MITSTILTKRELLQAVPFKLGLRKYQDPDWALRASNFPGVGVEFATKALTIWYIEENRKTITSTNDWQNSLDWVRENRHLLTPQAYASFILTAVSSEASLQRDWSAFLPLLREAARLGRPTLIPLLLYMGIWFIPQSTRRSIRALLQRRCTT